MQHDTHAAPSQLPADYLNEHRAGWHAFTRFVVANCVAVAALLVLMLIFLVVI
jgi:hypothetical protein